MLIDVKGMIAPAIYS